jgi:hypothetical protein
MFLYRSIDYGQQIEEHETGDGLISPTLRRNN